MHEFTYVSYTNHRGPTLFRGTAAHHHPSHRVAICPYGRADSGVGDCITESQFAAGSMDAEPVDCTDPKADARIDRVLDGAADLSACPSGPSGVAFPEPKRTFCTAAP